MARTRFTFGSFLVRVALALLLVFATYNPLEIGSYYHWAIRPLLENFSDFNLFKGVVGVLLVIGWSVFVGATLNSLGPFGTLLLALLFGLSIWWTISAGWVSLDNPGTLNWLILFALSGLLAAGVSWSHIRRRLTGQFDVDEMDN